MTARGKWRAALAAALLPFLAACSGADNPEAPVANAPTSQPTPSPSKVRKEYVILRELTKQHALQSEAGNEARLESVKRHLSECLSTIPDEGQSDEERAIVCEAQRLAHSMRQQGQ